MEKQQNKYTMTATLFVYAPDSPYEPEAIQLAEHLQVPLLHEFAQEESEAPSDPALLLRLDADGLTLMGDGQEMRGDFTRMLPRLKQNNLSHEMLVKAAKIKGQQEPLAIDATAGMGEDSLLLAAAGFRVRLYEQDPVIAALLRDTLRRSRDIPELADIVSRMELREENSVEAMQHLDVLPDVVVLDPMFPARQKSALVKKKFQLLHYLEQPAGDEEKMLAAAFAAHPRKIVIKRPVKGPYLAGRKPDYSLAGKAIRYDCFSIARQ